MHVVRTIINLKSVLHIIILNTYPYKAIIYTLCQIHIVYYVININMCIIVRYLGMTELIAFADYYTT